MARMQEVRDPSTGRRSPRPINSALRPAHGGTDQRLLHDFQNALQLMQESKFEKARVLLEKIIAAAPPQILDRARVYLVACERHGRTTTLSFSSADERYDYAISLLNVGSYEEARDQFEAILGESPRRDFAHYGMALLCSMTGQAEEALDHLGRAIEINTACRIQARSDPDFVDMADDPRFTELLYPDIG